MGRAIVLILNEKHPCWGSNFDRKVRQVWAMMEEYAEIYHSQNWKNLRALMEEFDDVKELSASENGCLLLQLVEDDDYGTEWLHKETHAIEVQYTNIFDELQGRLKRVGSNLDKLMQSSGGSSKKNRIAKGGRFSIGQTLHANPVKR